MKLKDTPKIRFLQPILGHDEGDIVRVVRETDWELYYYDSFDRLCYFNKSEEGLFYEYIPMKVE